MDSVLNGIMGLCVADALGVPVEFKDRIVLSKEPVVDMQGFGTYNQPAGTWSDDTSMTLCLLDSLAGGLNYGDIMDKFLGWYQRGEYTPHGEAFDIGSATGQALKRFAGGAAPLECGGVSEGDNGNGSLMRILPLVFYLRALYGRKIYESDEAFEIIHNVSSLTHAHNRSKIACGIYICIASEIINKRGLNDAVDKGINNAFAYYGANGYEDELSHYERLGFKDFAQTPVAEIKSSGYVVDTLEAAIWCLLNSNNYRECVLKAVNLGGDTDTVAAVAGGLAGLQYKDLPQEWLSAIYRRDYIEGLCERFSKTLNRLHAKRLCDYIPYFESATEDSVVSWIGGRRDSDNDKIALPHPDYDVTLSRFIDDFYDTGLIRHDYLCVSDEKGLNSENMVSAIADADFDLLRALLTLVVRQERFIDGLWTWAVKEKVFLKILQRFRELG